MPQQPITSFALCQLPGAPQAVRRLALTEAAQEHLTEMVREQKPYMTDAGLERVPFDPTYQTDDSSVLWISGFALPEHVSEAVDNPLEVPLFDRGEQIRNVRALFHANSPNDIVFQCWRNFSLLGQQRTWLLLSNNTFDLEAEKLPLVIDRRIDAAFENGDLLFRSYANTNSVLDMLDYVSEATEGDIVAFAESELFNGDANELASKCSRVHRRQIRLLVTSKMLGQQSVEELGAKATEVEYALPVDHGKIMLPTGGQALTELLRFLSDRIYRGPVTGDTYVANSARRRS